ncbi:MAG: DUF167 family protein [Pseudomonadota bacterium]|nr:DUF167 family protein [Pseudomonadota bacterium]
MNSEPLATTDKGLRIAVRLTPRASRAGTDGVRLDAAGHAYLQVRVTAPAEGGKANAALLKLLAKAWSVTRSDLAIVAGAKERRKTVALAGDPSALGPRLTRWFNSENGS